MVTSAQALALWMNGRRVGTWRLEAGTHRLEYSQDWLASPQARPVSLSLPLVAGSVHEGPHVESFFENLLPDDETRRKRLARWFGAGSTRAFDLLTHVGRESAGALQIIDPSETPPVDDAVRGTALDEAGVAHHLRLTFGGGLPEARGKDAALPFRISLGGAHAKAALLRDGERWLVPEGATPTTHIFKPPLGRVGREQADLSDSVENEWLCGRILAALNVPVASSRILDFEDVHVLVVERFDRSRTPGGGLVRLPQEDLCQALGIHPDKKYESDGGPGVRRILELLEASSRASQDRIQFFRAQVIFWLLAGIDGHAKNFSIFIEAGGRFHSTPLYDVLSSRPVLGVGPHLIDPHDAQLAMAVWGKSRRYHIHQILRRHFNRTAVDCRLPGGAEPIIRDLLDRVPGAVKRVSSELPADFPSRVAEPILDGLVKAAEELESMPPA